MEGWSNGVLKYWRQFCSVPPEKTETRTKDDDEYEGWGPIHSTTPPLHHSTTPPLHHSTTPPLHHSTTPSLHHSITPLLHYSISATPSLHLRPTLLPVSFQVE
jgi:hypothetical protein